MPSKFKIDTFEVKQLKMINTKLDKQILAANVYQQSNDDYKQKIFKESLWKKFLALFK